MQFTTFKAATVAVTALSFAVYTNAFWRMECRSSSGIGLIDPLISPGEIAEHAHSIFGSGGFSESAGYSQLVGADCTSCSVAQDKSAYWHPALYFKAANGQISAVPEVGGMLAYYLLYPNAGETKVTAFPEGFQMIAGDTNQRNFTLPVPDPPKSEWVNDPQQNTQAALRQKAIGFNCLNYAITPEGSLFRHFLPDKAYLDANCLDGVRFELMFPSCWNGDTTSANHKDHVAYPDLVMTGNCPPSHPTRLVSLFYEIIYDTHSLAGQDGEFIIANGDPTGYGYHGDFMMGWDGTFLQNAVDQCTNPSGLIGDCPLFTIQSPATYDACKFPVPADQKNVNFEGPMSTLPGDVEIQAGPAYATHGTGAGNAPPQQSNVVPTLSHSDGSTIATSGTYMPGGIFAASLPSTPSHSPSTTSTPPPPPPPTPKPTTTPLLPGQSILSTKYSTLGGQVLELVVVEEEVTITASVTTTEMVYVRKREREAMVHGHQRRVHPGRG